MDAVQTPLAPPHTYAEWVAVLDLLKNKTCDDEIIAHAMMKGTIEWQTGVAERFSKRLVSAFNSRANAALERFQRELNRSKGQERAIVQALLALRKELRFLAETMSLPALPENMRQDFVQLIRDQADKIQGSLEDSSKVDRSGRLLSIVRNNRVNMI
ncbi:MAG: hypothetical protein Q4C01_05205 [Clostridia bacterium]|nr:hypothetical protein [Clostridia bacterium]